MEEAIRKLEKMIENPSRADKIVYTRGDIEDAIEGINRLKDKIKKLEQENKNLKLTLEQMENTCKDYLNDRDTLREENRKLKERIDILYEFIERNDKLVDEVIDEEDLDKLNRYIYIDDDLIDKALESED